MFCFEDSNKTTLEIDYLFLNSNWKRWNQTLIDKLMHKNTKIKNVDQRAAIKLNYIHKL